MYKIYRVVSIVCVYLVASLSAMENYSVAVETTDKKMIKMPLSVLESSTALYMQYAKKKTKKIKKIKKIILFAPVDKVSLDLFKNSIIPLKESSSAFKKYYEKIEENGLLRQLINVSGKLQSSELTACLVHNYFPSDISEYIASYVMESSVDALRYKIIEKNCSQSLRNVQPVAINLDYVQEKMIKCSCGCSSKKPVLYSNVSGSSVVKVDSLDRMSSIIQCNRSGRIIALLGHRSMIQSINFSPNDNTLLSCSYDEVTNKHCMILWDVSGFECHGVVRKIKEINGYDSIRKIIFSPSGDIFVVALKNGIFRIYSGIDGKCLQYRGLYNRTGNKIKGISCPAIFFACEDRLLVVMNFDAQPSCSVWDAHAGKRLYGLNNKFEPFDKGYLSFDGRIITAPIGELMKGECFDLCGEDTRAKLAQLVNVIHLDIVSVYALWRWSIGNKNSNSVSDDESPLNNIITYFSEFLS